ncbi:hypothetical protein B0H14DRAFT_2830684 [Mycena olivaceomarginata]|nr:hypothetical protein B0H14DRAFT_2830684 [Mycena olivaceomarginata]
MPTLNAYKTIEEQKKTKDSRRRRMRWRGEKFLQILDLEDLDTLPLPHLAHSPASMKVGRSWSGGGAGAGGESEVEARRGTRSSPRTPTGSTPRRSSPHSSHWRDGWGRRWVRAHAAKPSARWQMFCAMGACTRDSVARPRCLPGRVVSWPPPPRLSRASRA